LNPALVSPIRRASGLLTLISVCNFCLTSTPAGRNAQTPAIRRRLGERAKSDPLPTFKVCLMNGREARHSGLRPRRRLRHAENVCRQFLLRAELHRASWYEKSFGNWSRAVPRIELSRKTALTAKEQNRWIEDFAREIRINDPRRHPSRTAPGVESERYC
jgi:hypothetical protein